MSDVVVGSLWMVGCGWMTVVLAQSVLERPANLHRTPRMRAFHDRLLRPFGAVLTFVFAMLTTSIFVGLIQLVTR